MPQQDRIIDLADFSRGFYAGLDTTKAPFGSFRKMFNARVTDRGGIAPRPGTTLLGTKSTNTNATCGFYNYRRSFESNQILLRAYDDELEGYSSDHASQGWFRIKNGFTVNKEFGFVHSLFNTSNENYVVGSNRYEPFFVWTGATTQLNGALSGGETAITVDSTLLADVYDSQTATSSSATTLTVSGVTWAADQWNGFYVYVTSGVHAGKVREITDTTTTVITFDTLGSDPGTATFEIRRLLFPETGTLIYGGTTIAYTAIDTATTFTVASAHAAADNTIVTLAPTNYEANPRGNRLTNYLGRTIVGNVRSALSRNSGGTLQGYASGGSYFVSKINNPLDFSFSGTRVAGEGDIQSTPYGGGNITDVVAQEETAYVFKRDYIEAVSYTQDANDLATRVPLKAGAGSVGKVTQGSNDVYFFTEGKQLTTIGRVRAKDIKPQTLDVGDKIKRWLERTVLENVGRGKEIGGKVYIPLQSNDQVNANDVMLVYNENTNSFEGIWDLPAFGIEEFGGNYYYASSGRPDVYQMFTDRFADVEGSQIYGYSFEAQTHFFNLTASKNYQQSMHGLVVEGYVRGGTEITYTVYKDFNDTPTVTFTLSTEDTGVLSNQNTNIYLGDTPLGINNLSVDYSDVDIDGRYHFIARVYFPFVYGNYFSVGVSSSGIDQDHETTRFGLMVSEEPSVNRNKIKSI